MKGSEISRGNVPNVFNISLPKKTAPVDPLEGVINKVTKILDPQKVPFTKSGLNQYLAADSKKSNRPLNADNWRKKIEKYWDSMAKEGVEWMVNTKHGWRIQVTPESIEAFKTWIQERERQEIINESIINNRLL